MSATVAIVIPVYNHARTVRAVAVEAAALGYPVWVVNDGSTDGTREALEGLDEVTVLHHDANRGKGAALLTGMAAAASQRARWVLTLDADGQHLPNDAHGLVERIEGASQPTIVLGRREGMRGKAVPLSSRIGRTFSNFWVWAAGGPWVSDSQTGFRLYPVPEVLDLPIESRRYQFEVEALVLARRAGIRVVEAPVGVVYSPPGGRISHFLPWRDFWRNAATFTRLIIARLTRPLLSSKANSDAT